jgi:8-oxo-dGTP diphosphatase
MTIVVAGILERDDKTLICRRRADGPHPLKWEFPGGKLEPGESPGQALTRELREELGIEAQAGSELMRYQFAYPGKNPILLIFLEAAGWTGTVENRIFETIVWESREALSKYDFLEGDARFLEYYLLLTSPAAKTERSAPGSASS